MSPSSRSLPIYITTLYAGKLRIVGGDDWGQDVWTGYRAENGEIILIERQTLPPIMTILSSDSKVVDTFEIGGTIQQIHDVLLSADGQIIVYSGPCGRDDCPKRHGTVVRNRTTKTLIAFYELDMHPRQWTSDGRLLLAKAYGDEGMFLTAVGGVEPLQKILMTDPIVPLNPRVSPKGTAIAFEWQNHIWMAEFDSQTLNVTWPKQISKGEDIYSNPAWSPDGKTLLMVHRMADEKAGVLYHAGVGSGRKESYEPRPLYGEFGAPIASDFGLEKPIITWTS